MSRLRIKQISDFSFTGSLSSGDFLQWNGTNWVNVAGPIDGAKGETGEKGAPGDDGTDGTDGNDGLDGAKGETGAKGDTGEKGAPSTVAGDKGEVGEKGEKGAPSTVAGDKGEVGEKGDKGAPSTVAGDKGEPGEDANVSISGSTNVNNRVVTMTGNASTPFQGESNLIFNGTALTGPARYAVNTTNGDSKFRFNGDSATYAMGLNSGQTYGFLNGTAMTFTVDNVASQGWKWRDDADSVSQGAMSLTSDGRLYIDQLVDVPKVTLRSGGSIEQASNEIRFTF